ncbi:Cysteine dioxygenase [Mactra antiquata]
MNEMESFNHCCSDNVHMLKSSGSQSDMQQYSDKMDFEGHNGCEEDEITLNPPQNLQELIEGLKVIFSKEKVNTDLVKDFMTSYKSNIKEWKKFAKFDKHRYTRNLVDEGNGKFNLMVLCWNEAQGSSIHSHANSHCLMKVLDGTVQEQLYDWPTESDGEHKMVPQHVNQYPRNQVAYINDDLGLHRVENPSHSDKAVTLHLYSPPFDECESFDEKTGHKNKARVTFWSKFGHRTPFGKTGVDASFVPENN